MPSPPVIRRVLRVPAAVTSVMLLAAAPVVGQQVDLETLLGAPFPSELSIDGRSGQLLWVHNERGVRNVWTAAAPDYVARPLTSYRRDDGQQIGSPRLSPDGATLVFVRGAGANRSGENPNPTSDPAGAEQALWRLRLPDGSPERIGPGHSPDISPDGRTIAFLRGGEVWTAPVEAGEPELLISARGSAGQLRWSPGGQRLAFVSRRGDHAFIGVHDVAARTVEWIAPSVDSDSDPVWSPDGDRLAYIRTPARGSLDPPIFRPVRESHPWSIRVADLRTGENREVWRAEEGLGSVLHRVTAENQLFWGADDRIVFPWEATGWTLLYAVPARGGAPVVLTPGAHEVEDASLSADRTHVLYTTNRDDIDRRHVWRAPVRGGEAVAVTRGEGLEWSPVELPDGSGIAYLASGARVPAHVVVRRGDRERALTSAADFPSDRLVTPAAVTITAADGMQIPGQLFLPRGARPGDDRPAVVFLHGGSRRQMLLGFHNRGYYHNAYALNQYLASKGFVVLSLNYRSGIGYGLEFREAPNYGATGGSEFYDVLGAGLYLRSRPEVDPDRIGLWGGSYGGYLTAMGLSRASRLFAAGVDIHGVHDWNAGIRTFIPGYDVLDAPETAAVAYMASPMSSVDGWESPVLVIHGDDDRNVSFAETVDLVEALREREVDVEQLVFPDEVHSFLRHENWLRALRATAEFLERKLENR